MKIGLDVHKVIDKYPDIFEEYSGEWNASGHEIHIVTGQERSVVEPLVHSLNITFTHFYSIVDYHKKIGTKIWQDDKRGPGVWMAPEDWLPSKGIYARDVGLDFHFDDSLEYAKYFPSTCSFVLVRDGFEKILEL